MQKELRKYESFDDMKADDYDYWQSRPVHERLAAVDELTRAVYALKGAPPDAFTLQRTLVRIPCPWR